MLEFEGAVWEWRGPAPFHFVTVPPEQAEQIGDVARDITYGWGMVPVEVSIGATSWRTSLWPKDGGYVLPVKDAVRKKEKVALGDRVAVRMTLRAR